MIDTKKQLALLNHIQQLILEYSQNAKETYEEQDYDSESEDFSDGVIEGSRYIHEAVKTIKIHLLLLDDGQSIGDVMSSVEIEDDL
jgi:hypothetical protein